ncbi:hypothetical protein ACFL0H_04305 [Thermodesulfobacteriota bacterium]
MNGFRYYIPGIILLLIAIIFVAFPEILIAIVAVAIIMAGIVALYLGHMIRKSRIDYINSGNAFSDKESFGRVFVRMPIFRRFFKR